MESTDYLPERYPFILQDFIDRAADLGIESVIASESDESRRDAYIAGFELARSIPTIEDMEFVLLQRDMEQRQLRDAVQASGTSEHTTY